MALKSAVLALFTVLFTAACTPEPAAEEGDQTAALESETAGAERVNAATLTAAGDPLAAPGTHQLGFNCRYARDTGSLLASGYPPEPVEGGPAPALLGLQAPDRRGAKVPLQDGTFAGRFEYSEIRGDGTTPTYFGGAEITLRIVDDSEQRFPILEIRAVGESEDGVQIDLVGRCTAMVTG